MPKAKNAADKTNRIMSIDRSDMMDLTKGRTLFGDVGQPSGRCLGSSSREVEGELRWTMGSRGMYAPLGTVVECH